LGVAFLDAAEGILPVGQGDRVAGLVRQSHGGFHRAIAATDDEAAVVPPMVASSTGTVAVRTVKLLTAAQMDAVAARARDQGFRSAGS